MPEGDRKKWSRARRSLDFAPSLGLIFWRKDHREVHAAAGSGLIGKMPLAAGRALPRGATLPKDKDCAVVFVVEAATRQRKGREHMSAYPRVLAKIIS